MRAQRKQHLLEAKNPAHGQEHCLCTAQQDSGRPDSHAIGLGSTCKREEDTQRSRTMKAAARSDTVAGDDRTPKKRWSVKTATLEKLAHCSCLVSIHLACARTLWPMLRSPPSVLNFLCKCGGARVCTFSLLASCLPLPVCLPPCLLPLLSLLSLLLLLRLQPCRRRRRLWERMSRASTRQRVSTRAAESTAAAVAGRQEQSMHSRGLRGSLLCACRPSVRCAVQPHRDVRRAAHVPDHPG